MDLLPLGLIAGMAVLALAACARPARAPAPGAGRSPAAPGECADCVSTPLPAGDLPDTEAAWRARLTPAQFHILRQRGTEPSGSGAYLHHAADGVYACAGCGQPLYDAKTKYDACGWPSFWDALPGAVGTHGEGGAVEAVCARCDGHLGHVFDDGPAPTGKRH